MRKPDPCGNAQIKQNFILLKRRLKLDGKYKTKAAFQQEAALNIV